MAFGQRVHFDIRFLGLPPSRLQHSGNMRGKRPVRACPGAGHHRGTDSKGVQALVLPMLQLLTWYQNGDRLSPP